MSPLDLTLIFFDRMFHFARHESIRVLLKDAQAGAGTEVDPLAAIGGAGVICQVFERAAAGRFVFRQWRSGSVYQI